jgi:hypothetical protein
MQTDHAHTPTSASLSEIKRALGLILGRAIYVAALACFAPETCRRYLSLESLAPLVTTDGTNELTTCNKAA